MSPRLFPCVVITTIAAFFQFSGIAYGQFYDSISSPCGCQSCPWNETLFRSLNGPDRPGSDTPMGWIPTPFKAPVSPPFSNTPNEWGVPQQNLPNNFIPPVNRFRPLNGNPAYDDFSIPFGPPSRPVSPQSSPFLESGRPTIPEGMEGISELPISEQKKALMQKTCPVTREPLGSMGKPILVTVSGQSIYVCCEGCVPAIQRNPQKYLRGDFSRR